MARKNPGIHDFWQVVLITLFLATPSFAQGTPQWEFFTGYSFKRADVREYFRSTPIIYTARSQYENLNGWEASITENRTRRIGGTLSVSGHYSAPELLGVTTHARIHSILYGPRFSWRTHGFIPFVHVLLGVAQADVRVKPVGPHASDLSFAGVGGGGVDLKLGKNVAIRAFQAEYFGTNVLGTRPHGYRASAGFVLHLGKRE